MCRCTLNSLISITLKNIFIDLKFFQNLFIFSSCFQSLKSHLNANFCLVWLRTVIFLYTVTTRTCLVKGFTCLVLSSVQFSSVVQLFVQLFATPWIAAYQASLSITNSRSLLKLMSIESVMPSSHLILCHPSPPAPNPSQHQVLFQWVNSSHEVAKVLEFQLQHQSFQ